MPYNRCFNHRCRWCKEGRYGSACELGYGTLRPCDGQFEPLIPFNVLFDLHRRPPEYYQRFLKRKHLPSDV